MKNSWFVISSHYLAKRKAHWYSRWADAVRAWFNCWKPDRASRIQKTIDELEKLAKQRNEPVDPISLPQPSLAESTSMPTSIPLPPSSGSSLSSNPAATSAPSISSRMPLPETSLNSSTSSSTSTAITPNEHEVKVSMEQLQPALEQLGLTQVRGTILSIGRTEFDLVEFIKDTDRYGLTGIIHKKGDPQEILCRSPEDVEALVIIARILCPEQAADLLKEIERVKNIKATFTDNLGFPDDIIDLLGFISNVLTFYKIFGDGDADHETGNRFILLKDFEMALNELHPKPLQERIKRFSKGGNEQHFDQIIWKAPLLLEYDRPSKIPLKWGKARLDGTLSAVVYRCQQGRFCVKDDVGPYFLSLFCPGLYLVRGSSDERTPQERLAALKTIGSQYLAPRTPIASPPAQDPTQ